jgi:pimeloyl-ACP methyl ester carboxylesterase
VFAVAFAVTGELGLSEPPDLVGHSLGGTVVSAYAAAFATRSVVNVHQPLELSDSQAVLQAIEPALQGDTSSLPRSSPCSRG